MSLSPPPSFVDLTTAYSQKEKALNIMGVVVDHLPATKSGGSDYIITFEMHDLSWTEGRGLKFTYFAKNIERLPAIKTNGDVVLLRNVKVKNYNDRWVGLSNLATTWAVFPESLLPASNGELSLEGIKVPKSSSAASPTSLETQYAIHLCNSKRGSSLALPPPPTSLQVASGMKGSGGVLAKRREKFSLIQDLKLPEQGTGLVFADLLGEVRKIFENDYCVELSITDYTTNKSLYNYAYGCDEDGVDGVDGDQFGYLAEKQKTWPGPWGKMTINIRMWDAHASFARHQVKLGDFVLLHNVHIGTGKDGRHYMEGKLRGDPNDLDRVGVKICQPRDAEGNARLKDLLGRKRDYEAKAKREHKEFIRDLSIKPKKRPRSETEQPDLRPTKNKSKKREGKGTKASTELKSLALTEDKKVEPNAHVRCQKLDIPLKPIDEIMDPGILRRKTPSGNDFYLPFQNCCYHSKVRVVDFLPNDIVNFACPHRTSDYDMLSDHEELEGSDIDIDSSSGLHWEWRFFLIVEDATSPAIVGRPKIQMPLLVANGDGDYLLDMEASDLRKDPRKLAQVREKLFVLWGDLQEQKEARGEGDGATNIKPSAKPFECLIKEYGIPARDEHGQLKGPLEFDRMFRFWGATIK